MKKLAKNHWFWAGAGFGLMAGVAGLVGLHSARADGVPADPTMYYAGILEQGDTPVTGTKSITVKLFDDAVAGTEACTVTATVDVENGHFRVPLPVDCTQAVQANPDLFAEVSIEGNTLARTRLGAVPYAVESKRATAASGPLATDLASITSDLSSLQNDLTSLESNLSSHESDPDAHHTRLSCINSDKVCTGSVCDAFCPAGYFEVGGGCDENASGGAWGFITENNPIGSESGWHCEARRQLGNSGGSFSVNAYVVCCR